MADAADDADPPASLTPEEAFTLLGDETRASVLRALGDAERGEGPTTPVSFSELRAAAAPGMDSGQFNYHLDRLVGHFVERSEEGYQLRPAGLEVYRAILAGTFTGRVTVEAFEVGHDCHVCDGPIVASYEDRLLYVNCSECDYLYQAIDPPPSAVDDTDPEAVLERAERYNRHVVMAYADGVCPHCGDTLETTFYEGAEVAYDDLSRRDVLVHRFCDRCTAQMYLPVGELLLFRAELVAFCHERGVDVLRTPPWELPFAATDRGVTVRSRDPWEVELRVELDGDELLLTVDEELAVREATVRD